MLSYSYVQVEKKKLFHIFLKQFLTVFQDWKPINLGKSPEEALTGLKVEHTQNVGDVVVGCDFGQPAEVILILIREIMHITRLLTDSKFITYYYVADDDYSLMSVSCRFFFANLYLSSSTPNWLVCDLAFDNCVDGYSGMSIR